MARTQTNDMWGALLMRGIAVLLFGIAAVFWPGITLVTLVYLFSALVLATGIIALVSVFTADDDGWAGRMLVLLVSLIEIGVGVYLLRHPGVSFATLILIIGFTLVIRGVFDVVGGLFASGRTASHKMLTVISGLLAGLAGLIILFQPASAGVAFVWILGLYALLAGPMLIAMSLDLKKASE